MNYTIQVQILSIVAKLFFFKLYFFLIQDPTKHYVCIRFRCHGHMLVYLNRNLSQSFFSVSHDIDIFEPWAAVLIEYPSIWICLFHHN